MCLLGAVGSTSLYPNLQACLRQLNGTCFLNGVVAAAKTEKFNDGDPAHMAMLESLWTTLLPDGATRPVERYATAWTHIGFQQQDPISDLRYVCMR